MEERRGAPRINLPCSVLVSSGGRVLSLDTFTQNISSKGIRVSLEEKLPLAAAVEISIELGDGEEPLKCRGQVVWVFEDTQARHAGGLFATGIKFVDIRSVDVEQIQKTTEAFFARQKGEKS